MTELLFIHMHGILLLEAGSIGKFLMSPSEIRNTFDFSWSSSERPSFIIVHIPRVRDAMNLVEPVRDLLGLHASLWKLKP